MAPAGDGLTPQAEPNAEPIGDARAAALRVLIAEDDTSARTGLMELLRAWGYDTIGAVDGANALAKVAAERPDIVLADLVMPKRDGVVSAARNQGPSERAGFRDGHGPGHRR